MEPSQSQLKTEELFLRLGKPITFFDLETTGTSTTNDRIVELYAIRLNVDGTRDELHHLINPAIPISPGATEVHGITDEIVRDKPTFGDLVEELAAFFVGCDLGGYNIKRFDVPMLMEEFYRHGRSPISPADVKMVDAMGIYHSKEKRDLSAAVRFYCEREHDGAHSAKADVLATIDILKRQLLKYDDLEPNASFLHDFLSSGNNVDLAGKFIRDENGNIIFNFGKHQGKEACTELGFLKWMLDRDFSSDTKMVAERIYNNCIWEEETKRWLNGNRAHFNEPTVIALYTAVKFGKDVFPFSLNSEGEKLTVMYLTEPPSSFTMINGDARQVLLSILDIYLRKKGVPLPTE